MNKGETCIVEPRNIGEKHSCNDFEINAITTKLIVTYEERLSGKINLREKIEKFYKEIGVEIKASQEFNKIDIKKIGNATELFMEICYVMRKHHKEVLKESGILHQCFLETPVK